MRTNCHPFNPSAHPRITSNQRMTLVLASGLCLMADANAAALVVRVTGIAEPIGQVGCALWRAGYER